MVALVLTLEIEIAMAGTIAVSAEAPAWASVIIASVLVAARDRASAPSRVLVFSRAAVVSSLTM